MNAQLELRTPNSEPRFKSSPPSHHRPAIRSALLLLLVVPLTAADWTNSLGMQFAQVPGTEVRISLWETRTQDFEPFVRERGLEWARPSFEQAPDHPAVNVSWEDATGFCRWLTDRERESGKIAPDQSYRLPTDAEWTVAVGLDAETGDTPEARSKRARVWPWGAAWPPLSGAGNYAPGLGTDTFLETSPVGSFAANPYGLFDLGGNVWEWCDDWYSEARVTRTLRGGSWLDAQPANLLSVYRFHGTMNLASDDIGFRIVLTPSTRAGSTH